MSDDMEVANREEGDYDQVDGDGGRAAEEAEGSGERSSQQAVSGSTQTDEFEFDTVDSRASGLGRLPARNGVFSNNNGSCSKEGGLLANLITMVLPVKRKREAEDVEGDASSGILQLVEGNKKCTATQTEESPLSIRAHDLCCMVIQELVLENPVSQKEEVFEALCSCICEILEKHSILFNGMLRRFEVIDYRVFTNIANELFEASGSSSEYKITWGRVVSLFAFAVRLAQSHKEADEEEKLDDVVQYLSSYISKNLLDFVETEGGWGGLVKQFPVPDTEEKQMKRAMMWSGLCMGLVATMYVSSFLSK